MAATTETATTEEEPNSSTQTTDTAGPTGATSAPVAEDQVTANEPPTPQTGPTAETGAQPAVKQVIDVEGGTNLCANDMLLNNKLCESLKTLRRTDTVSTIDMAEAQKSLYTVFSQYLCRKPMAEFYAFMDALLAYIHHNKEIHFTPNMKFRAVENLKGLTAEQISEFMILMAVFIDTSNPVTRGSVAKSFNWTVIRGALHPDFSEEVLSRLMRYYNVS